MLIFVVRQQHTSFYPHLHPERVVAGFLQGVGDFPRSRSSKILFNHAIALLPQRDRNPIALVSLRFLIRII
ncbi:MAG: hypothetical protein RI580_07720 [Halothece sp. Uz-M2-17]|nr:hypothetical protein [Halothece sp. Uz-M2-17]